MQVMPSTAEYYGIHDLTDPEENIKAGTMHLDRLQKMFRGQDMNEKEKVLFTLASYNAGEGRIAVCRNLAEVRGLDRNKWEEVVQVIPEMRLDSIFKEDCVKLGKFQGHETINYVDSILDEDSDTLLIQEDGAIYTDKGDYTDMEGTVHPYSISIYALSRGYAVYVHTDYTDYFAIADYVKAMQLPVKMMRIARSVHIDKTRIENDFNLRMPITYKTHKAELFQNMAPVDGTLEELLIDGEQVPNEAENRQ